ncbi:helix-turn-helix domain-containing protein [Humisphaera borealis]|uniref:Helix-turn-helix domain-containing protein n=1 Tax=Humisphaera borealis TaxID=2807512 RepID=A0A7M2WW72_9BACT|nr:hypothetical protein [Humisphaera borealis]QOV89462.1 hypothetical protein IPV69_25240 [Humisphaera borealis]
MSADRFDNPAAPLHSHQIRVDTAEELVTVQIGGEGSVPGGFAKFFNRVVDSEAWAHLSDAGRAAYIPMVRFADHRNQYRVQIGQASLMKYAGLSRSSIKRAIKDLLQSKLLVLVEQGGVTPDGRNESNLYQLMVPVDPRPRLGTPETPTAIPWTHRSAAGMARDEALRPNPLPVQPRTPSRFEVEPTAGPAENPVAGRSRTPSGARRTHPGTVTADPQLRSIKEVEDNNTSSRLPQPVVPVREASTDAAALLVENGVEAPVARKLAGEFPVSRIVDVIDTMRFRAARGKCDNPGGFIRDALVKQWQTPRAVVDARAKAEAAEKSRIASERQRQAEQAKVATVNAEDRQTEQLIAALDDDELEMLAMEVLKKYDGNTAVLAVLTRKPPRQCRLMKMEIAGMLGRG